MNYTAGRCVLGARVRSNTSMLWYSWFAPPYKRLFFVFEAHKYQPFYREIMRAKRHIKQDHAYSSLVNAHQDNLFSNNWPWGASEWKIVLLKGKIHLYEAKTNMRGQACLKFHCNSNNKHCRRKLSYNLPNTIKKKIWRTFKPAEIRGESPSTRACFSRLHIWFQNRYPPQIQDIISHQFTWLPMDTPQSRTNIS